MKCDCCGKQFKGKNWGYPAYDDNEKLDRCKKCYDKQEKESYDKLNEALKSGKFIEEHGKHCEICQSINADNKAKLSEKIEKDWRDTAKLRDVSGDGINKMSVGEFKEIQKLAYDVGYRKGFEAGYRQCRKGVEDIIISVSHNKNPSKCYVSQDALEEVKAQLKGKGFRLY